MPCGINCACAEISDFAVVPMGGHDRLDMRFFDTVERIRDHGGRQWWLYLSRCSICDQGWIVAQEERIHDNYYLKRVTKAVMDQIVRHDAWPNDFLRFEDVIRLGPDSGEVAVFFYPNDLTDTVKELIEDRADISIQEISYLLCVPEKTASKLMRRAGKMSWSDLHPFA